MKIRSMTESDLLSVTELTAESFGAAQWSEGALSALLETSRDSGAHGFGLVVVDETQQPETLFGFICCRVALDEAEILNLAVAATGRRRGLGTELLEAVFAWARKCGAGKIFLEVRDSNAAARALYEKSGFREISRRRGYYRHPEEDAVVLARELP